tara:strand:- start:221 stop:424 length:204 start_codon:yes stop_codon:yes gene_type:complete
MITRRGVHCDKTRVGPRKLWERAFAMPEKVHAHEGAYTRRLTKYRSEHAPKLGDGYMQTSTQKPTWR